MFKTKSFPSIDKIPFSFENFYVTQSELQKKNCLLRTKMRNPFFSFYGFIVNEGHKTPEKTHNTWTFYK